MDEKGTTLETRDTPRELDTQNSDKILSVHPHVDPRLSLPEHLQTVSFDDDLWRRMANSNFRHPSLTAKALRDDPEMRDLLRGSMAAASEREKEVLMHNQARVFTSLLHAVAKNVGSFLNTPLVPKAIRTINDDAGGDSEAEDKSNLIKNLLLFVVTPKVFLTAVALAFGVLAGYSQVQVNNLRGTIDTYESVISASKVNNETLEARIKDFGQITEDKDKKIQSLINELSESEKENVKIRTESSGLKSNIQELTAEAKRLGTQLVDAMKGKESTTTELNSTLASVRAELSANKELLAKTESELQSLKEALQAQEQAKEAIIVERDSLSTQSVELKTELANLEQDIAKARNDVSILTFAERALADIKFLTQRYSSLDSDHVVEHINTYESRKARHNN